MLLFASSAEERESEKSKRRRGERVAVPSLFF